MTVDLVADKLKGFIFDDDEFVTYKWLSKKLGVHVNISKQILWEFWRNHKEKLDMVVAFVIMGQLTDGSERIEIVGESNLSSAKEKFNKINCEHIYSLQKTLSNLQVLALAGRVDARFTAIKCKESFLKRSPDPLVSQPATKLQEGKQISLEKEKKSLAETAEEKHSLKSLEQKVCQTTDSSLKDENEEKEKVKRTPVTKEKRKKAPEKTSKKPVQSIKAGYHNIFNKVTNLNLKSVPIKSEEIERKENVKENCISFSDVKDTELQIDEKTEMLSEEDEATYNFSNERKMEKKTTNKITSRKNNKRIVLNDKETKGVVKKRKRILSDSDSSEEDSVLSEFEEETKEVTERSKNVEKFEKSLSSPEMKDKDGKRMIRKSEDIRFVDQDGFLVTKKVTVSVEATAEDVTEERPPPASRKEINVNRKQTKQSTLTSFFKRS